MKDHLRHPHRTQKRDSSPEPHAGPRREQSRCSDEAPVVPSLPLVADTEDFSPAKSVPGPGVRVRHGPKCTSLAPNCGSGITYQKFHMLSRGWRENQPPQNRSSRLISGKQLLAASSSYNSMMSFHRKRRLPPLPLHEVSACRSSISPPPPSLPISSCPAIFQTACLSGAAPVWRAALVACLCRVLLREPRQIMSPCAASAALLFWASASAEQLALSAATARLQAPSASLLCWPISSSLRQGVYHGISS